MTIQSREVTCRQCGATFTPPHARGRAPARCDDCRPRTQRKARPKGAGSVYRTRDGKWVAQVENGTYPNGRRKYARTHHATELEAHDGIVRLRKLVDQGVTLNLSQTVEGYVDWWLNNVAGETIKESTVDQYRRVARLYITPYLGTRRLQKLTPLDVQGWLGDLKAKGLAAKTRAYARAVLRRALMYGVRVGILDRNVAALAQGPKVTESIRASDALNREQRDRLLAAADGSRLQALAHLLLRRGPRKGEALALRWDDIDFERDTLSIRGTLKRRRTGAGYYADTPKTYASRRTIPMKAALAGQLRQHRKRQAAEQLVAGSLWVDSGFVFTTERGLALPPSTVDSWWKCTTKEALGKPVRPHAARHTFATLELEKGTPVEVVSKVLGHSSVAITIDVYSRITADLMRSRLQDDEDGDGPGVEEMREALDEGDG